MFQCTWSKESKMYTLWDNGTTGPQPLPLVDWNGYMETKQKHLHCWIVQLENDSQRRDTLVPFDLTKYIK